MAKQAAKDRGEAMRDAFRAAHARMLEAAKRLDEAHDALMACVADGDRVVMDGATGTALAFCSGILAQIEAVGVLGGAMESVLQGAQAGLDEQAGLKN